MNTIVDVRHLSLNYGSRQIVRNVSFQIRLGEFFVIIGPNGAGKTTLLKGIAGLHKPSSGQILLHQRNLNNYSRKELARHVAIVPQSINDDFPFNVAETVLMGRYPHLGILAMETREDRVLAEQAMKFTEVDHLAGRHLNQLSGGERQRVIIARAICQQPQILLLDEPTASLDPAHQLRIMDLMERLRENNQITVIMVSHDLNLASTYADRLLLLKDGKMQKIGPARDVLTFEQLHASYGCNLFVDESPLSERPRVSLVPEKDVALMRSHKKRTMD